MAVRGYKVKLLRSGEQVGIAVSGGLTELIQKAREKLSLQSTDEIRIYLEDKTLVDEEYFQTIEPQTLLIALANGEDWSAGSGSASPGKKNLVHSKTQIDIHSIIAEAIKSKT